MIVGISGKIGSGKDTIAKIIRILDWAKKLNRKDPFKDENILNLDDIHLDKITNWKIKKFAGKLKQIVSLLTGIPVKDLEKEEIKNSYLGEEWSIYKFKASNSEYYHFGTKDDIKVYNKFGYDVENKTVRWMLQKLGTEALRGVIHPNIHINALFADYKPIGDYPIIKGDKYIKDEYIYPNWLITDVRFPNEAKSIKDKGGILIRVNRDKVCPECKVKGGHKLIPHKDKSLTKEHPSETALDDYEDWDYFIDNNGSIEELVNKVKEILLKENIIK